MKAKTVDQQSDYNPLRQTLNLGLLAGIGVLYLGMVGMIESFQDREVIRDFITLAQLLMFIPAFSTGFLIGLHNRRNDVDMFRRLVFGALVGALTAIPTLILLFIDAQLIDNIRSVLVNVNRDWVEVVTFDNRDNLLIGAGTLLGALTGLGLLGSIVAQLPNKVYRAIVWAFAITITVGVFGETIGLVLAQLLPEDAIDAIFRRDVLKQTPAAILLGLSILGAFVWSFTGRSVQEGYHQLPAQSKATTRAIFLIVVALIFLLLPFIVGRALSDTAVTIGLFVLMGLGLNIAIGLAGLLDLGYVTNYAVGAYVMAVLTSIGPLGVSRDIAAWLNGGGWFPFMVPDTFINFWMILPVAILAAMFTGFVFAVPVLKMRGDYLAIATLGFGEIIGKLAISDWLSPIIGGAQGIQFVPKPVFFGTELINPEQIYYIILVACVVTLFVSVRLNNSRVGRQWMAIREDEDVASAMGINVARAKLLAFTLSAATGGLAGAIFAAKVGSVFPNSFTVFVSINVLSLIIVGGIGSNPGVFMGALVLIGMPELLREFADYRFLIYGALLIFMMINRPEGLWPSTVVKREITSDTEPDVEPGSVAVQS